MPNELWKDIRPGLNEKCQHAERSQFDLMISKLSKINYAARANKLLKFRKCRGIVQCRFMAPFSSKPEPTAMDHGN